MNNTRIIEHISDISTHPHAKLIAEWLLTGKQVEYLSPNTGCWLATKTPNWYSDTQYRLVNPKVTPAYRVYRYVGERGTNTQDRHEDGKLSHVGDESQIIWLSDWIEYIQNDNDIWPSDLVRRIAEIDINAAKWLKDNWNVLDEVYCVGSSYSTKSNLLRELFIWRLSEYKDYNYWLAISKRLGEQG